MITSAVAIGSLGGTITMTSNGDGGLTPTMSAEELIASVPELERMASLRTTTLASVPSASLSTGDVGRALAWASAAVDQGAAGVILIQGTDTLEETTYLLDLYWDRPEPLVVTAAMRAPQRPGSDGPANLLAAVATAAHQASRDLGVLAVINDEIHAARRIAKSDSMAVEAFRSPVFGPLGRLIEGTPVYGNRPPRPAALPTPDNWDARPRVALLTTHLDDSGDLLTLASESGYDGIVLAALGVGHVSQAVADNVTKAVARTPVVVATRTGAGPTAEHTYDFLGSESDLISRGAVLAGWLTPVKARLLLVALLGLGYDAEKIGSEFRGPRAIPWGSPGQ